MTTNSKNNINGRVENYKLGICAVLFSAVLWGVLPIYWQALKPIPSEVIIFYRIFLVAIVSFIVALKTLGWEAIKAPLREKGVLLRYFIAGVVITANWSTYIWAVNAGFVIQTSIGYYIEPLMVAIFGVVLFKEKLNWTKSVSLGLAFLGVIILLFHFGEVPAIALTLAITFAVYTAIKRKYTMPAILSLLYETMLLAPIGLVVIIYLELNSQGAIGVGEPYQYALLFLCGPLTALPLGLFAYGANNVNMVTLGITEYVSPSIALVLGIFLFKEPFDLVQFYAFVAIWIGLVFFTGGEISESRKQKIKEGTNYD